MDLIILLWDLRRDSMKADLKGDEPKFVAGFRILDSLKHRPVVETDDKMVMRPSDQSETGVEWLGLKWGT